ncbi:MAG: hypothetical protein ACERLB_05825 [Gammaproteobacteria bacterium]
MIVLIFYHPRSYRKLCQNRVFTNSLNFTRERSKESLDISLAFLLTALAEIRELDVGSRFADEFAGEQVCVQRLPGYNPARSLSPSCSLTCKNVGRPASTPILTTPLT